MAATRAGTSKSIANTSASASSQRMKHRLGIALADVRSSQSESPFAIAAIILLILTGARLREILTLRWDYADLENGELRLPDSKTGAKTIYLNTAAIKLLRTMPRMQGNPK
jgi:integrase